MFEPDLRRSVRLRIYLVRHGETEWNATDRMQGRSDVPLSPRGVLQSKAVAQRLRDRGIDAVYSSDLVRARDTARIIGEPRGLRVVEEPLLTETALGEWEGLTEADIIAAGKGEALRRYRADGVNCRPPGSEPLAEVADRMLQALSRIAERHIGGTILIVGHGGSLRVLFCHAIGVPAVPHMRSFRLANGSLSLIEYGPHGGSIHFLNDTCHLATLDEDEGADR